MTKDELKQKLRSAFVLQKQIEAEYVELQNLRDNASRITPRTAWRRAAVEMGSVLKMLWLKL